MGFEPTLLTEVTQQATALTTRPKRHLRQSSLLPLQIRKCTCSFLLLNCITFNTHYIILILKETYLMSSMLLRQFIEGRSKYFPIEYTRLLGPKSGQALDKVIPNITKNLTQSNLAFLEAIYDLDEGFIQQTATKGLQKRLLPEFSKLKSSGTTIKEIDLNIEKEQNILNKLTPEQKEQIKSMVRFTISPYVIFGTTMEQRFEEQNPWDNIMTVASNRFIYKDPKGLSLNNIMNKQVFGFNCFTTKLYKGIEISEGGKNEQYQPKQTIVTFETNADNHEFFVADFNLFTRHS